MLVCTGPRCSRVGSPRLFRDASDLLERRRLAYYKDGGTVRLSEAGCLGACGHGPTLACYRGSVQLEQAWYFGADLPLVLRVAEAIQNEAPLPDERRYDR
jgi:(2Fe-2S) ferredoxin